MTRENIIDLLRSLSVIEGATAGIKEREIAQRINNELEWIVPLLLKELKDRK